MGNNQSVDSDNENDHLNYKYHENVLRDAEERCNLGGYESDDNYFSAEEGDSDASMTPPRTRPESSSGEDFSDDSASDDGDEVRSSHASQGSNVNESSIASASIERGNEFNFISPRVRKLAVKKSCGHCNVSRFQEHDSIGPELNTSRWDANTSSESRCTRQSQQSRVSHDDSMQLSTGSDYSPFVPINSPPSSHNVSLLSTGTTPNKRRAYSSEKNSASPNKKKCVHISPNKRRLSMRGKLDSESEEEEDVVLKKPCHSKTVSSGDEDHTARSLLKRNKAIDIANASLGEANGIGLSANVSKSSSSPDVSDRNVGLKRRTEFNRNDKCLTTSHKIKSPKLDHMQSEISNDGIFHQTDSETFKTLACGRGIKRLRVSAFQPLRLSMNKKLEQSLTKTEKMGHNAIRNSLGKVLPTRNAASFSPSLIGMTESTSSVQVCHSDSTLDKNRPNSLRFRKLKVIKLADNTGNNSNNSAMNKREIANVDQVVLSKSPEASVDAKEYENINPVGKMPSSENATCLDRGNDDGSSSLSPFQNVVLTPPSTMTALKKIVNQAHHQRLKRGAGKTDYFEGNEDEQDVAMETKKPDTSIDSEYFDMHTSTSSLGQMIHARPKRPSAAARLKSFFSNGNLKSNISTFFFKRNSSKTQTDQNTSNSNQSTWSLFSSPPTSSLPNHSLILPNQLSSHFQSSSPIHAVHSPVADKVNFTPISSTVAAGHWKKPSPLTSPLMQGKKGYNNRVSIRTSPCLQRHSRVTTPSTKITDIAYSYNDSDNSIGGSESLQSLSRDVEELPQTSEYQVIHCCFFQTLTLSLCMGDIAEENSAGIVNWTDASLTHNTTDCSRSICAKAGALMRAACNSYLENKDGVLEVPDVLTTPAGGSFPKCVTALLHVTTLPLNSPRLCASLLEVNANCMRFANERLRLDTLSMPLIGEGELPTLLCVEAFVDALLIFITEKKSPHSPPSTSSTPSNSLSTTDFDLVSVCLISGDANVTDQAAEVIKARIEQLKSAGLGDIVSDIHRRYYKSKDPLFVNTVNVLEESKNRAKSGRPRLKRPRL